MNRLKDQMAIVTGAGEGIGRGVALFLASEDSCYVTGNTVFADSGGHINGVTWAPDLQSRYLSVLNLF